MRYRTLGSSGLFVSEMCLGTMTFGFSTGHYAAASGVGQDVVNAIVKRSFEAGINFIDTANVYAEGQAEEMICSALKELGIARQQIVLATKAEHATGKGPNDGGASRYHLIDQVKGSLKRLGTDHIDLYQLHGWDPATPIEETMRALDDLVRQGHIRYVGVANWSAWQTVKAMGASERLNTIKPQSFQGYYSLAGRDLEREIVTMVEDQGLGLLVYSPLAGGYLSGKYRDGDKKGRRETIPFPPVDEQRGARVLSAMDPIAKEHMASMVSIALAWLLQQRAVTSVILGVKRLDQLEENLKALDVELTPNNLEALGEASALPTEYPGWMFASADAARMALLKTGKLQGLS